jgi:mannose-6-phosphate isomerase-like protein (cupin superfamily)
MPAGDLRCSSVGSASAIASVISRCSGGDSDAATSSVGLSIVANAAASGITSSTYPSSARSAGPFFVRIRRTSSGQPNSRYRSEPVLEGFLVLHGECVVILNGEERPLRQWDFLYCPTGTEHVFVGSGDGPCAVLMIGARREVAVHCPDEVAAKYDASVTQGHR